MDLRDVLTKAYGAAEADRMIREALKDIRENLSALTSR